jgi:hypothetical protein
MRKALCSGSLTLALLTTACSSHHADVGEPTPAFLTTADALGCARSALADVRFLVETRFEAPPGQRSAAAPVETPTSVTGRIVSGQQTDYVGAFAHARPGPQGDSTVTLTVRAGTQVVVEGSSGATVRPLSSLAVRARDAVVAKCHATIEHTYLQSV